MLLSTISLQPSLPSLPAEISEKKANSSPARFIVLDPKEANGEKTNFVPVSSINGTDGTATLALSGLVLGLSLASTFTAFRHGNFSWEKGSIKFRMSGDDFRWIVLILPAAIPITAMTAAAAIAVISTIAYNRYNSSKG